MCVLTRYQPCCTFKSSPPPKARPPKFEPCDVYLELKAQVKAGSSEAHWILKEHMKYFQDHPTIETYHLNQPLPPNGTCVPDTSSHKCTIYEFEHAGTVAFFRRCDGTVRSNAGDPEPFHMQAGTGHGGRRRFRRDATAKKLGSSPGKGGM